MNIPLKPEYADWIANQVDLGRYASEIEAIEEAIEAKMRKDKAVGSADEHLRSATQALD